MNTKILRTTLIAAGLLLGTSSNSPAASRDGVTVRFEFESAVVMEIPGYRSLNEAMRAVADLTFVEGGYRDHDRYIFMNGRTSEKLLITNHYGLVEVLAQ